LQAPRLQFHLVLLEFCARETVSTRISAGAGRNLLAFADENFRDEAAFEMLDDLVACSGTTRPAPRVTLSSEVKPAQEDGSGGTPAPTIRIKV